MFSPQDINRLNILVFASVFFILFGLVVSRRFSLMSLVFSPTTSEIFEHEEIAEYQPEMQIETSNLVDVKPAIHEEVTDLDIPWDIDFLPDETMLVTERSGQLLKITKHKNETISISGVAHVGEGGLLGVAVHPNFNQNKWIYLYLTTNAGDGLVNRVERYRLVREIDRLTDRKVILENIPGAQYHDGGQLAFGPDGMLYITNGDASNSDLAQDMNSLAGKILRVTDEGEVPADNPFGSMIYSLGHRNSQGLAWDDQGQLWSTDHGPSGTISGFDEINLVTPGSNMGWPLIKGDETQEGLESPIVHSGATETWAPSGMAIFEGNLFFSGLRGSSLYVARIDGQDLENRRALFWNEYGRIRAVTVGPDQRIYFSTSNRDGRGTPQADDDKIISIDPSVLITD